MKTQCPYCMEKIKSTAIACPHCSRDFKFFDPLNKRINGLEKQTNDIEKVVTQLAKKIDQELVQLTKKIVESPTTVISSPQPKKRNYLMGITLSFIPSALLYAAYLWIIPTRPFTLWLSIIFPLFIGIWIGYNTIDNSIINLGIVGVIAGLLTAIGIATCVEIFNKLAGEGGVDWNAVFRLYFAPPIFLIMSGGFLGTWYKNLDNPDHPNYSIEITNMLSNKSKNNSNASELVTKLITAITPLLTSTLGILTSVQAIAETIN